MTVDPSMRGQHKSDSVGIGVDSSHHPRGRLEHIEKRLLENWLIIDGDPSVLTTIEDVAYTPETPANADFEIIGFPNCIHLGRKNKTLRKMLNYPEEWHCLQVVTFATPGKGQVAVCLDSYDSDILTKEQAAAQMAAKAGEFLKGRR